MKSVKNTLQEYCQKHFGDLPTYLTELYSEYPTIQFVSKVTLPNNLFFKTEKPFNSKKEAEKNVAQIALDYLQQQQNGIQTITNKQSLVSKIPTWILVDLENYPQVNDPLFLNTSFSNVRFESFVGKCSSFAQKDLSSIYPFMHKITVVDSVYKNAVDHFISVRLGQLICELYQKYPYTIIIISRDAFAGSLVDCFRQVVSDKKSHCYHVVTVKDCYDILLSQT